MLKRVDSIEDQARGVVRYDLGNGQMACFDLEAVRLRGVGELLRYAGVALPKDRVPVWQGGRKIGSVPWDFEPMAIKSRSALYDVRQGDFRREAAGWIASDTLGFGDLDAVPGFNREV
jgi:hypothetical protein